MGTQNEPTSFSLNDDDSDDYIPMEMDITQGGPRDADSESSSAITVDTQFKRFLKWVRLVAPHIGLVVLVVSYTLAGAVVFHILELPHEEKTRAATVGEVTYIREKMKGTLWRMVNETDASYEQFTEKADHLIAQLIDATYGACSTGYIASADVAIGRYYPERHHWDFPNSIFFSTTVITSIGYGNLAPATRWGRSFCIGFGLIGIPLLLVTIADIGKFLSDFLNFSYRTYRALVKNIRRTSRRLSHRARRSLSQSPLPTMTSSDDDVFDENGSMISEEDNLRIPIVMVLLVLLGYTALGGLLFQYLEGWEYFDAFYFCFITMVTIGFGDMVPTKQQYMFITMGYIVLGLALTTMCIDLAGTEYIRKIHYLGQKMESAKSAMRTGINVGEKLLHSSGIGFIRTAAGDLVAVNEEGEIIEADYERNILYEPLAPNVQRAVAKANIEVMPDHITERDVGLTFPNRVFNQKRRVRRLIHPNQIHTTRIVRQTSNRKKSSRDTVTLVAPFLWKESHV